MQNQIDFKTMMDNQRRFFKTGTTRSLAFRIEQLKILRSMLKKNETDIAYALKKDLNKSTTETVITELQLLTDEISYVIKHLKNWIKPKKVTTPFPVLWPGSSFIHFEPYGSVLIIAPWNYPFFLTISPLVGAISAGNCAVIKPSEIAQHSQDLIQKLISQHFPPEFVTTVTGGAEQVTVLLQEKFDYLFFTGGTAIGKIIMEAAAKDLTPVTLELGGKSPCIVDASADLDYTARRIIWGKMTNAGQTCIAPDYLYVHHSCCDALIAKLQQTIKQFYGDNPETSDSYGRIINEKHFQRLSQLMQNTHILFGGKTNPATRYIEPTLIRVTSRNEAIMQQEIFGPLLPILSFNEVNDVIFDIRNQPKPLALYLFTKNKDHQKSILEALSFGGGCLNDCLLQTANYHLPFGGVGLSGIGAYHGKTSFELFSHAKSMYKKTFLLDIPLAYPPYTNKKLWWLKQLLKL
jgi:acyl-CoA reductase-like NAD-dependent aldehyde dehydrogenase